MKKLALAALLLAASSGYARGRVYLDDAAREARLARLKDEPRACP